MTSPLRPAEQSARDVLRNFLYAQGRDISNPWALGHTLLALGEDVSLDDGRSAVDAMFETYGLLSTNGARQGIRFPKRKGSIRVEPHRDLMLKALTEIGIAPAREVTVQGKRVTLEDLYCESRSRTWWTERDTSFVTPNDSPWALQGLAAWTEPGTEWTTPRVPRMTVDALTERVVHTYHQETQFIRDARRSSGTFQKRKQGIFQYTCGGAHLLQGAAYAVARGHGGASARELLEVAGQNLLDRYEVEQSALDDALRAYPQYELKLRIQRLKFLGHFVETMHKLAAYSLVAEEPAVVEALTNARMELAHTVATIQEKGWFDENLSTIRAADEQAYHDLLGDAAHALRGLDLSSGEGTVSF